MRIVLCCAGGFSTTMLMENMKKVVQNSQKLDESKFSFIAIPVDQLPNEIENCDAIVVGPQIAHKVEYIESVAKPYNVPFTVVDKDTYGEMDGATVMKQVLIAKRKQELNLN